MCVNNSSADAVSTNSEEDEVEHSTVVRARNGAITTIDSGD